MASAGYKAKVQLSSDGTTWVDIPCSEATINIGGTVLDATTIGRTPSQMRSREYGLGDWSLEFTWYAKPGTTDYNLIRDAWNNRTKVYVKYLVDGTTAGFSANSGVIESVPLSANPDGLLEGRVTIQGDGGITWT